LQHLIGMVWHFEICVVEELATAHPDKRHGLYTSNMQVRVQF